MSKKSGDGKGRDDYEIGYKKPPKHTRWKTGQSGNKSGRRKKRVTLADVEEAFDKALGAYITVSENGTVHQIKKLSALATQTVNKALKGNHQATNTVLTMLARRAAASSEGSGQGPTADDLKAEFEAAFREIAAKAQSAGTPPSEDGQTGDSEGDPGSPDETPSDTKH